MKSTAALLALGVFLLPQAPSPPAQERIEPGIIRGRVTAADSGRPLRRAVVRLTPDAARTGRPVQSVSTNSQGAFELRDVAPGAYVVSAGRAGYLELRHGQRTPREPGIAIDVRSGATVERIDIALPRGSVIAGRVVDELGAPYSGVRVVALELQYQLGERVFFPVGIGTTDDRGHYRIHGLQPGRYRVFAESSETWRNEKRETLGYAATFYPSTPSPEAAALITLGVAQQRVDVDFALAASRTARLRGRVQGPEGAPLAGETVSLGRSPFPGLAMPSSVSARSAADGSFELRDVPPGSYGLRAGARNRATSVWLTVTGADVDNLLLVPRSGSTVRGVVVTETGEAPPFTASGVRMSLLAPLGAPVTPTVRLPAVNSDWTFTLENVGGPFVFRIVNLPDDWMLHRIVVGERDITDVVFDVPMGEHDIADVRVELTDRIGQVSGSVVDAAGKPTPHATVVVFSDEPAHWTLGSRFVRTTRPTVAGTFTIKGLPAGRYFAVAREFILDGEWESREFLEAARTEAADFLLETGGTASIALKLPPR